MASGNGERHRGSTILNMSPMRIAVSNQAPRSNDLSEDSSGGSDQSPFFIWLLTRLYDQRVDDALQLARLGQVGVDVDLL